MSVARTAYDGFPGSMYIEWELIVVCRQAGIAERSDIALVA